MRFVPSVLLTLGIAIIAPYVGVLRERLFEHFPMRSLMVLLGGLLLSGLAALLYAFWRIRSRRLLRFLGLIGVVLLVWGQNFGFGAGDIEVNLIEKIHIVEYGLLGWWLYGACRDRRDDGCDDPSLFVLPLLGCCLAGTLDETVQFLVATRTGDVHDVYLDVYSGACGVLFALCVDPPRRFRWRFGRVPWIWLWTAAATLGVGLFFGYAHLGYLIDDPEIGQFRSWHRSDELLRLAEERRVSWRVHPPGSNPSPWRLEDRYLTEAGWHVGHRDRNFELGYYYWVLQANRILETYFDPYLDLEGFRRRDRRRYTENTLRKVEVQAPSWDPYLYRSPVLQKRIHVWITKPVFYGVLAAMVLSLLWASRRAARIGDAAPR